jgi:hypothetical protein
MATHDVLLLVSDVREPYRPLFSYSFAVALYGNDRKRIRRACYKHTHRQTRDRGECSGDVCAPSQQIAAVSVYVVLTLFSAARRAAAISFVSRPTLVPPPSPCLYLSSTIIDVHIKLPWRDSTYTHILYMLYGD